MSAALVSKSVSGLATQRSRRCGFKQALAQMRCPLDILRPRPRPSCGTTNGYCHRAVLAAISSAPAPARRQWQLVPGSRDGGEPSRRSPLLEASFPAGDGRSTRAQISGDGFLTLTRRQRQDQTRSKNVTGCEGSRIRGLISSARSSCERGLPAVVWGCLLRCPSMH
jgi:hypothetical protein